MLLKNQAVSPILTLLFRGVLQLSGSRLLIHVNLALISKSEASPQVSAEKHIFISVSMLLFRDLWVLHSCQAAVRLCVSVVWPLDDPQPC